MRSLLARWFILAVAVVVVAQYVPGVHLVGGVEGILIVAAVFGLVNAFIRPIISMLTCPLIVLTLGLFTIIINALMLWLTSVFVPQYLVLDDLQTTLIASIAISIVSAILNLIVHEDKRRR
jgi:putative membrane protein